MYSILHLRTLSKKNNNGNLNRYHFYRIVLLWLSFLTATASAADFSMWVGEEGEYPMSGVGYYNFRLTSVTCTNPSVSCRTVGWIAKWKIEQFFSGTATIVINYSYQIQRGQSYKNDRMTLTISCRDNQVTVAPSSLSLKVGEYYDLSHQFQKLTYLSHPSLQWSTDNSSVITVSSGGRVTAKGPGTATVYLDHSEGSNRGTCYVTVVEEDSDQPDQPDTPGQPVQPQLDKLVVLVSPMGGEVAKGTKVYLTARDSNGSTVSGAWIHYTLDGSTPMTWSPEFSSSLPIIINETCTLKAFAEWRGYADSDILTVKYTVKSKDNQQLTITDLNGDGNIDEADIKFIIGCIMGTQKSDLTKADINGDKAVNVADIVEYVKSLRTSTPESTTGTLAGHEWVDLGLPSGTKWATCNVGATRPEGLGDYYAWGETSTKPKSDYTRNKYKYDGIFIGDDISGTSYDAARHQWGSSWRIPTYKEWQELCKNCTQKDETKNGIKGTRLTGKNGNSIFFPQATDGSYWYWSSTFDMSIYAYCSHLIEKMFDEPRHYGMSIRAVW